MLLLEQQHEQGHQVVLLSRAYEIDLWFLFWLTGQRFSDISLKNKILFSTHMHCDLFCYFIHLLNKWIFEHLLLCSRDFLGVRESGARQIFAFTEFAFSRQWLQTDKEMILWLQKCQFIVSCNTCKKFYVKIRWGPQQFFAQKVAPRPRTFFFSLYMAKWNLAIQLRCIGS